MAKGGDEARAGLEGKGAELREGGAWLLGLDPAWPSWSSEAWGRGARPERPTGGVSRDCFGRWEPSLPQSPVYLYLSQGLELRRHLQAGSEEGLGPTRRALRAETALHQGEGAGTGWAVPAPLPALGPVRP